MWLIAWQTYGKLQKMAKFAILKKELLFLKSAPLPKTAPPSWGPSGARGEGGMALAGLGAALWGGEGRKAKALF